MKTIKETYKLIMETDGIIGLLTLGACLFWLAEYVYIVITTPISL